MIRTQRITTMVLGIFGVATFVPFSSPIQIESTPFLRRALGQLAAHRQTCTNAIERDRSLAECPECK
jgi:hypothetical protein